MKKKPEFHGSDLEKIADYYHLDKEKIVLFGANVNPLGLSGQVKKDLAEHLDIISSYPDRDYTDLKKAIAAYTNTSPEHIVVGNGSTELISLLISQRAPKRALLLGPTYSEYARELNLVGGTLEYYNLKEEQDFRLDISDLTDTLEKTYVDPLAAANETWAIAAMDLSDHAYSTVNAEVSMQSASVIKAFIMAAVFDKLVYTDGATEPSSDYENSLKSLLTQMITVSDNDAANELARRLGGGDFQKGASVLNEFCQEHGYASTHLGREFLASNPTDDNYTSASDCCRLLSDIYSGTMVNTNASADMLTLLKAQTRTGKIPSGIPSGVETANKTGELSAGDGLGVVENDIAIVFDKEHPYVLCVLSNNIQNNSSAQETIKKISADVYQYMTSRK